MAIEPVESHLAREERFKCIQSVRDYMVITANSAGVVSLMDLRGAVNMISVDDSDDDDASSRDNSESNDDDPDEDDEMELAVDIIESVRLGTGARITCLAAWCKSTECQLQQPSNESERISTKKPKKSEEKRDASKRKHEGNGEETMDAETVKKARALVEKAKKLKSKRDKKKKKKVAN